MVDNALIIHLSESEIQVVPLISDACINCQKSGCTKQGKPFSVANPKNLEIKKGDIVRIKDNEFFLINEESSFDELIKNLDAHYIIVSYNSEGFMTKEEIEEILSCYGSVKTISINYNTYRGCRNLNNRELYVDEYLFVLNKGGVVL